mmetsp:Transcript_22393/g.32110  ORF Transcript_22393/g.32110 Transcript_22393/m.32110 type:complete len:153 (+) Transcript_22393:337-795(+)
MGMGFKRIALEEICGSYFVASIGTVARPRAALVAVFLSLFVLDCSDGGGRVGADELVEAKHRDDDVNSTDERTRLRHTMDNARLLRGTCFGVIALLPSNSCGLRLMSFFLLLSLALNTVRCRLLELTLQCLDYCRLSPLDLPSTASHQLAIT